MSKSSLKRPITPTTNGKDNAAGLKSTWSDKVYDCVVCVTADGTLNIPVEGGSDNGEYAYFGSLIQENINYLSGRIEEGDIILEIQGQNVAGFTQRDVIAWLNHCCRNASPITIRATKGGLINKDLRQYLNTRFPKGTPDYELQTAVRDNLYLRTVPCTTRPPRDGEVNGVDYTFLTPEEFMALERSGSLLECGIYEGNHYGTPKPPKESPSSPPHPTYFTNSSNSAPGVHPSSEGKRRRNRSSVEAMTAKTNEPSDSPGQVLIGQQTSTGSYASTSQRDQRNLDDIERDNKRLSCDSIELGPLPENWEKAYTEKGELYFIDHNSGTSQWLDPRLPRNKKPLSECNEDELPYGWEKIDDPHYGTYYIDHVHKRTQYENPVVQAKRISENGKFEDQEEINSPWSHQLERISHNSGGSHLSEVDAKSSPSKSSQEHQLLNRRNSVNQTVDNNRPPVPGRTYNKNNHLHNYSQPYVFTQNPSELHGDIVHTSLVKSARGFGFTIVGGDEGEPEQFLQIKSVVPHGPAWQDGKLQTGDVLVYVNNTCVLGYSHQDVVSLFQSIAPGNTVHLQVCRGYSLPFDPNDPNTEIVTTVAVSNSINAENQNSFQGGNTDYNTRLRNITSGSDSSESVARSAKSMPDLSSKPPGHNHPQHHNSADLLNSENTPDILDFNHQGNTKPEYLTLEIVKGNAGFGFTIADSVYGQKVKKILDRPRCKLLQEGDILVEINESDVRGLSHTEVVQALKDCPCGDTARITVQRGGLTKTKVPKMKSSEDMLSSKRSRNNSSHSFIIPPTSRTSGGGYFQVAAGAYRSKTPTADLYSSRDKETVSSSRPKTPLVDTRNWSQPSADPLSTSAIISGNSGLPSDNLHMNRSSEFPSVNKSASRTLQQSSTSNNNRPVYGRSVSLTESWRPEDEENSPLPTRIGTPEKTNSSWYATLGRLRDTYWTDESNKSSDYDKHVEDRNRQLNSQERLPPKSHFIDETSKQPALRNSTSNFKESAMSNSSNAPGFMPRSNTNFGNSYSSGTYADWKSGNYQQSSSRFDNGSGTSKLSLRSSPYNQVNLSSTYGQFQCNSPLDNSGFSPGHEKSSHSSHLGASYFSQPTHSPGSSQYDSLSRRKYTTSFEHENPLPTGFSKNDTRTSGNSGYCQFGSGGLRPPLLGSAPEYLELTITLLRQESGFGFRIVGGTEEGSQVSIGHIVPGGAADLDGRLHSGDEILFVDGQSVLNTSHHHVVQLMGNSALKGRVTLGLRRRITSLDSAYHTRSTESIYPYDVTVTRKENEGFGFVIISSVSRAGSTIGRIIENSPADRCGQLHVGDRILAVNGISILSMHHGDIVNLIKDSGYSAMLTVGPPQDDASSTASTSQRGEDHIMEQEDQYHAVELHRGTRGFGFSIRGGREFQNMPLFVLRIAENGPACQDGKLQVGDQIIEINGINTKNMTHAEAIELIRQGGNSVRLLIKRGHQLPPAIADHPSPVTSAPSGFPSNTNSLTMSNGPVGQSSPRDPQGHISRDFYGWGYEPH